LEYDGCRRVMTEVIGGGGSTLGGGTGQGTYSFAYLQSDFELGYNNWFLRTTETYADTSTDTVYTNGYGEVMLTIHQEGSKIWRSYTQYDTQGRIVLAAGP